MNSALFYIVAGAVALGLGALVLRMIQNAGRDKQRAERAEADLVVAKKQGAIIAEQRTREDAEKRLDDGSF